MQWSKWSATGSLCAALLVGSSSAYGQTAEAKAEELFNKAVELSESRNYAEACPLLAESQKLDPRASTMFAQADCEREAGNIASSVKHFKAYLTEYEAMKGDSRKRHEQRANISKRYIKTLEPLLPMLKLTFPGGIPGEFVLTRNADAVERISLDKDIPVDPGEQRIIVQVPGRKDAEQRITIAVKEKKVVDLIPGPPLSTEEGGPMDGDAKNVRRTLGFVLLGTGAAGIAFGGIMGGLAVVQKGTVTGHCKGLDCDPMGIDAATQGRTFGNLSTVGFAAGGVMAAAGLVLVLTAPKSFSNTGLITGVGGSATPSGAFISVEGQF